MHHIFDHRSAKQASMCACRADHQVAPMLEQPVGMALYEYRNGQIGPLSVQLGERLVCFVVCCLPGVVARGRFIAEAEWELQRGKDAVPCV